MSMETLPASEVERVEIGMYHVDGETFVNYAVRHWDIVTDYDLGDKLLDNDDGLDTVLYGVVKNGQFFATSVLEGEPGRLFRLTDNDFVLFCEALDIPYIDPRVVKEKC